MEPNDKNNMMNIFTNILVVIHYLKNMNIVEYSNIRVILSNYLDNGSSYGKT